MAEDINPICEHPLLHQGFTVVDQSVTYTLPFMAIEIVEYLDENDHSAFGVWFDRLPATAAAKVVVVLYRINRGLLGDVKSVGGGVWERRVDFGPGYRIYFASIGKGNVIRIVVVLGGGTKKRQNNDIEIAKNRWKEYKARRRKGDNFGIDDNV